MHKSRVWKELAMIALGAAPLATVSTCDYGPEGGYLYYDQIDGDNDDDDDGDDYYYEDDCCGYYYGDCCYYDEDEDD